MNYPLHFLKIPKHVKVVKIKNDDWSRFIFVKGWIAEGHITKVVEWIVIDFGLLILN